MNAKELSLQLRNIGEKSAERLLAVGIDSPEKLKEVGVEKTYLKILSRGLLPCSFNASYLYALHGAIIDCDWRKIPEEKKNEYKQFTEDLRSGNF